MKEFEIFKSMMTTFMQSYKEMEKWKKLVKEDPNTEISFEICKLIQELKETAGQIYKDEGEVTSVMTNFLNKIGSLNIKDGGELNFNGGKIVLKSKMTNKDGELKSSIMKPSFISPFELKIEEKK